MSTFSGIKANNGKYKNLEKIYKIWFDKKTFRILYIILKNLKSDSIYLVN